MRRLDLAVVVVVGAAGVAMLHAARPSTTLVSTVAAEQRVGVVDVLSLVEQMLQLEQFAGIREDTADELTRQIDAIQGRLAALSEQLNSLPPGAPEGQQVFNQLQAQRQQAQQFQERSLADFQRMSAAQAAEVYSAVREAVDAVSAREGYTFVFASRKGDDLSMATSLPAVTQDVLARPVLVGFEHDDLTALVRAHLDLPDPDAVQESTDTPEDDAGADEADAAEGDAQDSPEADEGEAP